jgi:argininosuccinate synthase
MELLLRTIEASQQGVTGTARVKLYKGNCEVVGRKSPVSLYDPAFATFEADQVYRQADAEGFIRLNALRLRIRALRKRSAISGQRSARTKGKRSER